MEKVTFYDTIPNGRSAHFQLQIKIFCPSNFNLESKYKRKTHFRNVAWNGTNNGFIRAKLLLFLHRSPSWWIMILLLLALNNKNVRKLYFCSTYSNINSTIISEWSENVCHNLLLFFTTGLLSFGWGRFGSSEIFYRSIHCIDIHLLWFALLLVLKVSNWMYSVRCSFATHSTWHLFIFFYLCTFPTSSSLNHL